MIIRRKYIGKHFKSLKKAQQKDKNGQLLNRLKYNAYQREWRRKNKQKWLEIQMKHYWNNQKKYCRKMRLRGDNYFYNGMREIVLKRYKRRCFLCGKRKKRIVVHHLDGTGKEKQIHDNGYSGEKFKEVKKTTNNDFRNLVPLCQSCHSKLHWGTIFCDEFSILMLPYLINII